ncbi:ATPase component of an ABC superfamily vitamin B12 transporter [Trabulsiella guamensis ATCC 49490]|uniref:Vitamin B12 import ATP-binding protein BtuD n=1 Tax=Trabulsiella guamensis ATCC 49490 TaxID=1005994 RepID=A0A085AMY5_9ENTR|nr:vitamin B12 ABC transporter ATP-binding protein BtuD [Trabulsiella guamensis]KFC11580.1 ATPase component of an ABC superfamily vitamin B12 transporter [Trabulsiella guamensis ATCC 49490]
MSLLMQLHHVEEAARLGPFSADVQCGEILHLVGPNGAGKSTLLTRMAGLSTGKGQIIFNDRALASWSETELAHHRAYLTQQQTPPFAIPVWQYLMLHQHDKSQSVLLNKMANALGLTSKLGRQTNQLSGGEWQRVRLAAVMLQIHPEGNPHGQLLLLDEPMNSLDVAQQAALDGMLNQLCAAGITVVMSSHDLNYSLRNAHRVWLMRDGKLIASGKKEEVLTPEHLYQAWQMHFKRLDISGHQILVSAQPHERPLAS